MIGSSESGKWELLSANNNLLCPQAKIRKVTCEILKLFSKIIGWVKLKQRAFQFAFIENWDVCNMNKHTYRAFLGLEASNSVQCLITMGTQSPILGVVFRPICHYAICHVRFQKIPEHVKIPGVKIHEHVQT